MSSQGEQDYSQYEGEPYSNENKLVLPNGTSIRNIFLNTEKTNEQLKGPTVNEQKRRLIQEHYNSGLATYSRYILVISNVNTNEQIVMDDKRQMSDYHEHLAAHVEVHIKERSQVGNVPE